MSDDENNENEGHISQHLPEVPKKRNLTLVEKRLIESPAASNLPPADELLFQHTVFCQTSLPYRDPGEDARIWERKNGFAHLKIIAGDAMHPVRKELLPVGLPFGTKPRLVLAHLNAEALRTGRPDIEVEDTLSKFVERIGLARKGRNYAIVKDQLARLSAATVRLGVAVDNESATMNMPIVHKFNLWFPKDERQRVLWPSVVQLSKDYFESLQKHAVPLHPDALASLSHSAMGLDVYSWLAQRLHRVKPGKPQLVPWKCLYKQFGWNYSRIDNFRRVFLNTLKIVKTQYPDARYDVNEQGLLLEHSTPPILCRKSPVIRSDD